MDKYNSNRKQIVLYHLIIWDPARHKNIFLWWAAPLMICSIHYAPPAIFSPFTRSWLNNHSVHEKSLQFSTKSVKDPRKNKVQKLTHFYRCSDQGFIVLPLFKRNTFSWFKFRGRKRKQGCDPLFAFCFLPNCQSRVCCPAGYMTLSVSSHIIMEITSKKGMTWKALYKVLTNKLQFSFVSFK